MKTTKRPSQRKQQYDLEKELNGWLGRISEIVIAESVKAFAPIVLAHKEGFGLHSDSEMKKVTDEIKTAATVAGRRASNQIFQQFFFESSIPSLLAGQSRKRQSQKASHTERPNRTPFYHTLIRRELEANPDMSNREIEDSLYEKQFLNDFGETVSLAEGETIDGRPDDERHYRLIKRTTFWQTISTLRNEKVL